MSGKSLGEGLEAAVRVDVVNDKRATGSHRFPGAIQLETKVAFAVETIVNEEVNLSELSEQTGKAAAAGPANERPSIRAALADGDSDLLSPLSVERRQINAPEVTCSVPRQCFQNEARGDTMRDAGLDHFIRPKMPDETPYRTHESRIAVVPTLEAHRASLNPLSFYFLDHLGP